MAINAALINNYIGFNTQQKEPSQNMDKDAFLKLLVAQLQNQDPSQSQDPAQMVQQMTAFSQLEQIQNVGDLLKGIQNQNVALFQSSATTLVGKTVRIQGVPVELKDALDAEGNAIRTANVGLDLPVGAHVTMVVKDSLGRTVATIDKGFFEKGHHDLTWDGKTEDGSQLDAGAYQIEFTAADDEGNEINAMCVSDLKVDSIAFADGTVLIVAGGKYYLLNDIIEVKA
jgi:flagellar basal-body rod modification protein FlgD